MKDKEIGGYNMYKKYGYVRVGAIVPKMEVANVDKNVEELIQQIKTASKMGVNIVVTPELSITGYSCADLFHQDILLEESLEGLKKIVEETKEEEIISIIGLPIRHENQLFNCAAVIEKGSILGLIPKTCIPSYAEFYEKRWFASSKKIQNHTYEIDDKEIPFGTNLLFQDKEDKDICFGIEICEDVWSPYPPSISHALHGATILFNLSASNEVIGKAEYRKNLLANTSAKTMSAYVYASSGLGESTTDLVFGGASMIFENGRQLKENERFTFENNITVADIDIKRIMNERSRNTSYMETVDSDVYQMIGIEVKDKIKELDRMYAKYPFVPKNEIKRSERCQEIINIQSSGLAKRLLHTHIEKCVIGISGGLDSTLAFLVILEAFKKLNLDTKNIIAVTMPGFGTTDRTYDNACKLVTSCKATLKEVSIKDACIGHMKDIQLDTADRSVTYENAQARERTQILMDIANKENALVIGTGDLSELALGWCTYNGDHMSMYAVNSSIPKTLVKYLVKWVADMSKNDILKSTIYDILDTPISPELLPPEKQEIKQKTEDTVGPYMLHDFFLYHFMRYGTSPEKIYLIAKKTFEDEYSEEEIKKWLIKFIQRFFTQQFKRSCMPDGPKVGTISVSPRGDLRLPSDAVSDIWIKKIKKL